jgi:hypothetical protein
MSSHETASVLVAKRLVEGLAEQLAHDDDRIGMLRSAFFTELRRLPSNDGPPDERYGCSHHGDHLFFVSSVQESRHRVRAMLDVRAGIPNSF